MCFGMGIYSLVTYSCNNIFVSDLVDAKRILREIKLLGHFNSHENIITVLDIMATPPGSIDITVGHISLHTIPQKKKDPLIYTTCSGYLYCYESNGK